MKTNSQEPKLTISGITFQWHDVKQLIGLIALTAILLLASCQKSNEGTMTVVRDCTGTYLQFCNKDYRICNTEMTNEYAHGSMVRAAFVREENCDESQLGYVCMMYHEHEYLVKVTNIR